jgi:hemolysin type calcium-binding protein
MLACLLSAGCGPAPYEPLPQGDPGPGAPAPSKAEEPPGPTAPESAPGSAKPTDSAPDDRSPDGRRPLRQGPCHGHPRGIVGTAGDDVLRGTRRGEFICGRGGDDVIHGGGGRHDQLFGEEGDDTLAGGPWSDRLSGGPGDDVLRAKGSSGPPSHGEGEDIMYGDAGHDVLMGGGFAVGETMYAGSGNDILLPTATRLIENFADAGPGHDVVVAVNLANDMVDLNGIPEVSIGAGACTWQRPLNIQPDGSAEQGRMSCTLPWPRRLSGLDPVLAVSGSIDPEGDASVSGSLFRGMGSVAVADWRRIARGQNGLDSDVCICDRLVDVGQPVGDPRIPWDSNS